MEKFLTDLFKDQSYDPANFFLLAGPCVVESEELVMEVAEKVSANSGVIISFSVLEWMLEVSVIPG